MAIPNNIFLDLGTAYPGTLVDKANVGMGFTTTVTDGTTTPYIVVDMEVATTSSELSWLVPHTGSLLSGTMKNILAVGADDLSKSHSIALRISLPEARAYVAGSSTNGTQIGVMAAVGQNNFIKAALEIATDPNVSGGFKWYIIGQTKAVINGTNTLTNINKTDVQSLVTNTAYAYLDLELRYNALQNSVSIWYKFENTSAVLRSNIFTPGVDHSPIYQPNRLAAAYTRKNPNATNSKLQAKSFELAYTHVEIEGISGVHPATLQGEAILNWKLIEGDVVAQPPILSATGTIIGERQISGDVIAQTATTAGRLQMGAIASADMYAQPVTMEGELIAGFELLLSGSPFARRATTFPNFKMKLGVNVTADVTAQPAIFSGELINSAGQRNLEGAVVAQPATGKGEFITVSTLQIIGGAVANTASIESVLLEETHIITKSKMQVFSNIQASPAQLRELGDEDNVRVTSNLRATGSIGVVRARVHGLAVAGTLIIDLTKEATVINTNDTPAYLIFSLEDNK